MKNLFHYFLMAFSLIVLTESCYNDDNLIEATCTDGILNQDEVFIDCGGPNCNPCVPTCDNGIQDEDPDNNWIEEGVDCGGPCESCCGNGVHDAFEEWVDCGGPECEPCEQCNNGVQDGAETGIDCDDNPATECPPCSALCNDGLLNGNETCADCGGACVPCDDSYCFNGVLDDDFDIELLNEEGIDCGGCQCPPCISLCNDGVLNGNEIEVDCGGDDCPPCADQCADGVQNGLETGIDCDDNPSTPCPSCISLCNNGIFDGAETNEGCGGPDCAPCYFTCFINYDVTYNAGTGTEITDHYESKEQFIKDNFDYTASILLPPTAPAIMSLGGGDNPILFFNNISAPRDADIGTAELEFLTGEYTMNNVNSVIGDMDEVIFVPPNAPTTFYSSINPVGITLNLTEFSYQDIPGIGVEATIKGTFSGDLYDAMNDAWVTLSNGEIEILLVP
ncbi:MAG: hypothetical protein HKN39_07770 [Flavobacteriales bacterium]|nr:hypothetical protein [Flavobacteriales bacterium]